MKENLSFEEMPQAILELLQKVESIQTDVGELKERCSQKPDEPMIGIDEACKILHRANQPCMLSRKHIRYRSTNRKRCSSSNARN